MLEEEAKARAVELALLKAKAGARGNLRAVKQYDLMLKQFLVANNLEFGPDFGKVRLPSYADATLKQKAANEQALLNKYQVPIWFRAGYSNQLRLQLWMRLSNQYQKFLIKQNKLGRLPLYSPAPSYWAKHIRPSDFLRKQPKEEIKESLKEAIAQTDPAAAASVEVEEVAEVVAQEVEKKEEKVAEVLDLQSELAAESVEEQALVDTLEQPGAGMLRSEEPWYEDKGKLLLAFAGGLVLMSAMKE